MSFPPPGLLPDPGIELASPVSPALAGRFFITEPGNSLSLTLGSVPSSPQGALVVRNPPASAEDPRVTGLIPWVGKIPWSRKWQPTPVFLPGKSHGERSLWTTVCGIREEINKTMTKQQQQQSSLHILAKVIFHYKNITMSSPSLNFYRSPQFKVQNFKFLTELFLVANDYFSSVISPFPT